MPDKDTKKNQQENTTPAVSATEDIQRQRKDALDKAIGQVTFNPDSTNIESMEKAAIARQNLTDDQKHSLGAENAIHNAYSSPIQETSDRISEWETARNTLKAQDETAQRRGRSMQMIAGISDGLASLANLIGVGQGGTNIDMGTGSLTPLAQKLEAARLERKADIKSIDDRIEQAKNQLMQMKLSRGTAVAASQEKAAERAFQTSERLGTQTWKSGESALDRNTNAAIAGAKIQATQEAAAQDRAFKAQMETYRQEMANARAALNASGKGQTGANAPVPVILKGEDGKWYSYDLTKAEKEAIDNVIVDAAAKDAETDANANLVYQLYLKAISEDKFTMGSKQEIEDLRNQLIQVSPSLRSMITNGRKGTPIPMGGASTSNPAGQSGKTKWKNNLLQ